MMRAARPPLLVVAICVLWTLPVLLHWRTFDQMGALSTQRLWEGQLWRLFTALLLHAGLIHLGLNSLSLYFLGPAVVERFHPPRFLWILILSGLSGHVSSLLFTGRDDLILQRVGISGAVFGLAGALLAFEWLESRGWKRFLAQRNVRVLLGLILLNALLATMTPQIDQAAHYGGLVGGILVARWPRWGFAPLLAALLYAIHPVGDSRFEQFSAERRYLATCERLREPGADWSEFDGLKAPRTLKQASALGEALRAQVGRLLPGDPAAARALLQRGEDLCGNRLHFPPLWQRLGEAFAARGELAAAQEAWHREAGMLPLAAAWRPALEAAMAARALLMRPDVTPEVAERILPWLVEDAFTARGALGEGGPIPPEEQAKVQTSLEGVADLAHAWLGRGVAVEKAGPSLGRLYQGLADLCEEDSRLPRFLYRAGLWHAGGAEEARARMEAAQREGERLGDAETVALARKWLAELAARGAGR